MKYKYKTNGTCSSEIAFDINGDVVTNISYKGGCDGNLKAICTILDGWTVDEIEKKCKGITCGWKSTSCSDQLAKAVRKAYDEQTR